MSTTIPARFMLRTDTAAALAAQNPLLLDGEQVTERDTQQQKVGNGSTLYNDLSYLSTASAAPDASVSVNGKVRLTGGLGGTAAAPTALGYSSAAALASAFTLKADLAIVVAKADTTTMNSALALKADSTALVSGLAAKADASATTTALGLKADTSTMTTALSAKVQIGGDLGGTIAAPTVPGLANKLQLGAHIGGVVAGPLVLAFGASAIPNTSAIDLAPLVQAAHDALPGNGGPIVIPPAPTGTSYVWNSAVVITKPVNIRSFAHRGGSHANAGGVPSSCTITVASGVTALQFGTIAGALFCGSTMRDLAFKSADGMGRAVYVYNMSHCVFNDISITGFTTGTGFEFYGDTGQYSRLTNCFIHGTRTSVRIEQYNSVVMVGCYIDPANNNQPHIASSVGLLVVNGNSDATKVIGCQFQGCETCIDTEGEYFSVSDSRFEIFGTGIKFKGKGQILGCGNSFNNSANTGGPGLPIEITSAAENCVISKFSCGAVGDNRVTDAGANTRRDDCWQFQKIVPAVASFPYYQDLFCVTPNGGQFAFESIPRKWQLTFINAETVQASGTNYYKFSVMIDGAHDSGPIAVLDTIAGLTAPGSRVTWTFPATSVVVKASDALTLKVEQFGTPVDGGGTPRTVSPLMQIAGLLQPAYGG